VLLDAVCPVSSSCVLYIARSLLRVFSSNGLLFVIVCSLPCVLCLMGARLLRSADGNWPGSAFALEPMLFFPKHGFCINVFPTFIFVFSSHRLRTLQRQQWGDRVRVVAHDMRTWKAPEMVCILPYSVRFFLVQNFGWLSLVNQTLRIRSPCSRHCRQAIGPLAPNADR